MLELNKEEFATEEDKKYQIDCMNADDYVREECRAREDDLRLQRSIKRKHEHDLAEKASLLAEIESLKR
ncbi:MAG: hypothetical protein ACI4FZ_12440 [Lachnospiraceae bacterium]